MGLCLPAVLVDRALHVAFAAVVGRQRQLPVAEAVVQELQVVERGAGRRQHVAAAVVPPGLLQAVLAAGGRDELPHAGGAHARVGRRVVGALDHRQQRDLGGHAALLQLLHDVEQVAAGCARSCAARTRGGSGTRPRGAAPAGCRLPPWRSRARMRSHRSISAWTSAVGASGRIDQRLAGGIRLGFGRQLDRVGGRAQRAGSGCVADRGSRGDVRPRDEQGAVCKHCAGEAQCKGREPAGKSHSQCHVFQVSIPSLRRA